MTFERLAKSLTLSKSMSKSESVDRADQNIPRDQY